MHLVFHQQKDRQKGGDGECEMTVASRCKRQGHTPCGDILAAEADVGAGQALAGAHRRERTLCTGVVAQAH